MKLSRRSGLALLLVFALPVAADYRVVDTGQDTCYDDTGAEIADPSPGDAFYGQDAQVAGYTPVYTVSADGLTVYDETTGLTWKKSPDLDEDGDIDVDDKLGWTDAQAYATTLNDAGFGGYDDWRLPSIKELYSLILFTGIDPSGCDDCDPATLTPFIDTEVFDFGYGDTNAGERIIDAQYWSSTEYVSTTMNGDHTVFGVNFADGRIKGYPTSDPQGGGDKLCYVLYVRGNTAYGVNEFADNGDGTVTDLATGLVWQQADDGVGRNWEEALAYSENLALGGCDDWRLPNAKELQSIVDYSRSPDTSASAAIDPVFAASTIVDEGGGTNYAFYWASTTHANMATLPGRWGVYVAFGEALGWMQPPWGGTPNLMDVHGAGSQRSDPKSGDPDDWPYGNGPQGDVVRIYNHVRAVRGEPVPACEIRLDGATSTTLDFHPTCPAPSFQVVTGQLSELRADGDFSRASCLGTYDGQAEDSRPNPSTGDGFYYLARGLDAACASRGYGEARGVTPDPRDDLETYDPCP